MGKAVLLTCCLAALLAAPAAAQQPNPLQQENQCMRQCQEPPSFSGIETDAEWRRRMDLEHAYNRCRAKCQTEAMGGWYVPATRPDDGSQGYFKRNTFPAR